MGVCLNASIAVLNACRSAQSDLVMSVSVAFCLKTLFKLLVLALMAAALEVAAKFLLKFSA
jgi:hypothetical protein